MKPIMSAIWFKKLFQYRWAIGLLILSLAIVLEINCSSIGMWNVFVPNASDPNEDVIIGVNRAIRSDEWRVFTPMAMSQYYNDFGLTSDILRGTETDVYMVYGQPVRDWSIIFRPFQIGYLFLSQARGLSFYWIGKLVFLFLVSVEFGLLLTEHKKVLAVSWGVAVTLSPVVQWWFSTNAFPDMLVYGQGIVLSLNRYLETESYVKRSLFALELSWLCGCYLLVMYPSWQISFFYVFLAIIVWVILSHRETASFHYNKDIPLLGSAFILLALSVGLIVYRSREAIQAVMDSVYPGVRLETGGIGPGILFRYLGNIFFPFRHDNIPFNECVMAVFLDLFPLGLLAALSGLFLRKKKDILILALLAAFIFLGAYTILGFPVWLSKATLLNRCQGVRVSVAVSFINLLLLFRSMSLAEDTMPRFKTQINMALALVLSFSISFLSKRYVYHEYLTDKMFLACFAAFSVLFYAAFANRKFFCAALCCMSLAVGGTVNPVRHGVASLLETAPAKAVQQISAESNGKWLAVSNDWAIGNYLIASGAHTLNNTNTYLNREFWSVLDPEGISENIYNRYAHITVNLTTSADAKIDLLHADSIKVIIPVDKLKELDVEYLFSNQNLSDFNTETSLFEEVFSDPYSPYRIFRFTDVSVGN